MKKLIAMMLMLASVLFFSCKDDEEKTLSPEEAKTALEQLGTEMSAKLNSMQQAEGIDVMATLMSMPYPFQQSVKSVNRTAVFDNIREYMLPMFPEKTKSAYEAEPFVFEDWVGTYTWDAAHQMWDPDFNNPSDKIIIEFPTEGSNTNNATLTINNYDEILIGYDYMPTDIDAELTVDGTKLVGIDLAATWVTTGDYAGDPVSLDLAVYLYPFEFTVNFEHAGTSVSIDVAIDNEGEQFFSAGLGATFENSTLDDAPVNINGYIQLFDVKFQASVDFKDLLAVLESEEYTSEEEIINAINNEISAAVYVSGAKAADIKIALNTTATGDELPIDILFVYSDGSSESAIPYFENFALALDDFFYSLDDYYSTW